MLKAEWQYLKEHHFTGLVIFVLCFLPTLYAIPFLGSLWDTYGNVKELPVAVVNQDEAVTYQKHQIAVGDELVKELKKSDELDFTFTDGKKAHQGLEKGDYYMVVTIPKSFSKHATSILDQKPQKMQLDYETSSGHSFIAGKLSDSAAEKMRQQVSTSVTKAYTNAMMTEIKGAGKDLAKASDGNQQLADGADQLKDGSQQLTDGLDTLAASTLTFGSGAGELNVGLNQYVAGVGQASQGNAQVGAGLQQMQQALPAANQGVSQLSAGQQSLTNGLGESLAGQQALVDGLTQSQAGAEQLNQGITDYTGAVSQLAAGSKEVSEGVGQIKTASDSVSPAELKQAKQDLEDLQQLVAAVHNPKNTVDVNATAQTIETMLATVTAIQNIQASQNDHTNAAIDKAAASQKLTPEQTQAIKQAVQASQAADQKGIQDQLVILKNNAGSLAKNLEPLVKNLEDNQGAIERLTTRTQSINWSQLNAQVAQARTMQSKISKLDDGANQVTNGLQKLNQESAALQAGGQQNVGGQNKLLSGGQRLASGGQQAYAGSQQLQAGVSTMASKMGGMQQGVNQLVDGNGQVQTGLNTLQNKGNELTQGSNQLADGANQLHAGSTQLADGSKQIGPALTKMQQGNQTLADKMDDAVNQVAGLPDKRQVDQQMASPVKTKHQERDHVANNGTGMAPYMFSVGLFIGMLGMNLMLDLLTPRTPVHSLLRWIGSKFVIIFSIATMMAVVLFLLNKWILGMNYVDPMGTLRFLILIAWMDAMLVTALNLWFGRAGSFVSVVLLVAQLSLSAGTYPIQLSPEIYQKLHAYVPMTYTVQGLRETMMIGETPNQAIMILSMVLLGSMLAVMLYFVRHQKQYRVLTHA
ncbi:YhgE/Pip family protein [Weissella minor]|uniref:YhgE/Pip family protein n=1 Tax=Weissella minor TaxID=1620 RepID=UPI003AF30FDD